MVRFPHVVFISNRGCESTNVGTCLVLSLSELFYSEWFDYHCNQRRPYLCERRALSVPGDPCASNPCRNEGHCVVQNWGGYVCVCHEGYTGKTCETGKEETATFLCLLE